MRWTPIKKIILSFCDTCMSSTLFLGDNGVSGFSFFLGNACECVWVAHHSNLFSLFSSLCSLEFTLLPMDLSMFGWAGVPEEEVVCAAIHKLEWLQELYSFCPSG